MIELRPAVLTGLLACGLCNPLPAQNPQADTSVAGNKQVEEIIKTYGGRGTLADDTPPTPPQEALKRFTLREGFEIELIAHEPEVRQPLFVSFDHKNRLWVTQYIQYQFPAGLKIVEYDNHLRAQFDKVPEPPPHGVKGADKITFFEDKDGDGTYESHTDAITGLNIATSAVWGHGGIWVTNPPYLLFYPDANDDGLPDGDPEVCLRGFGLEDTHSVVSSLQFGPDGWLYGATGSTTTGTVSSAVTKEVHWQGQNIWRYHPDTKVFEIYAEGGGNTFSLEIDSVGRVFSGTNGGGTRGMYYPQGSYGVKGWGKHGPLTNPYAFGYFEHMRHEGDNRRFPQAFCIYEGGRFPFEAFDGHIIAPNSLQNVVWVSERLPDTSTYRTVDQANLVETPDRWFRPVWGGVGNDGCFYMADWYDTRLSHVRPVDDWHKDSGRIYRIKPKGEDLSFSPYDIAKVPDTDLLGLLSVPNKIMRRHAVLTIGWESRKEMLPALLGLVRKGEPTECLEALWAVNLLGGLTEELAIEWLSHQDEHVRRWVIRLIGDRREAGANLGDALSELAAREPAVQVRSQLASSAKRLPAAVALPIIRNLLGRSEDQSDLHLPLLDWWALEAHAEAGRDQVLRLVSDRSVWDLPLFREEMAARLMRRYAMAGGAQNFDTCAKLLGAAPDEDARKRLMTGLVQAFEGMTLPALPEGLSKALAEHEKALGGSAVVLGVKRGDAEAIKKGLAAVANNSTEESERIELARVLGETGNPAVVKPLLGLLGLSEHSALKRVTLQALARYEDASIPTTLLSRYGSSLPSEHEVRSTADRVLASRKEWAQAYLKEIDAWHIKAREIAPDVVQLLLRHNDPSINALVARHWPELRARSSAEKVAEMDRVRTVLKAGTGSSEAGHLLFTQRCAVCHKLFEEGNAIGPELTGYERGNLDFWLPAMLDPSLEIREGFNSFVATTKDGRKVMGMVAAQEPQTVTLRDPAGQTTVLNRADLASLEAIPVSLMPEGLLIGMDDQQLRDLFAYLRLNAK
ncbi:MAG: dehydrogenase [Verrucomicrobiales bacterium]|nr:c-type cytochrome [Verrucomicrobiae bacterium]MCP5555872.1 c-type cytochrome [Akkermansiaceae bacterium]